MDYIIFESSIFFQYNIELNFYFFLFKMYNINSELKLIKNMYILYKKYGSEFP